MAGRIMELAISIRGQLDGSVGSSMKSAAREASNLRRQIGDVNREMREAQRAATAEQRATGSVSEATYARIAALQARINAMTERRTRLLESQAAVERASASFSSAKESLAGAAVKTAVLAAPLVAATKAAMDYESAMADVRKVVDFDTPDGFKNMSNDILELSQRLPMAANDIARIVAAGGQSGIAAGDLMEFAEAATKMGIAFDVTADQAGDMMAKWRTAFKMDQGQVVELADKINYLGNTTAASAPLISDVVTRIGPLGEIGGVASGEIAALGASMVGTGVQSDVAATGIKNLILGMTAGEGATKSQAAAFQALGLNAADMAKRMQTDAKGAIMDVFQAIQSLPKDQQATILADLFGKESIGAIAPLLSNLDALSENFEKVADSEQYAGSMEAEYQARSQTTENQLQLAKNSLMAVAISIGSAILPALNGLLGALAPIASGFASWANENRTLVQILAGVAAAIAGVVLAALTINAAVAGWQYLQATVELFRVTTEGSTRATLLQSAVLKAQAVATRVAAAAQAAFNAVMSANPVALVILAIVALIGAMAYLFNTNQTFHDAVIAAWQEIKSAAAEIWAAIAPVIEAAWEGIKSVVKAGVEFLKGIWASIGPSVMSAFGYIVPILIGVVTVIKTIWVTEFKIIAAVIRGVIAVVSGTISAVIAIVSVLGSVLGAIFNGIASVAGGAWSLIKTGASMVWAGIVAIVSAAVNAVIAVVNIIAAVGAAIWQGLVSVASAVWQTVVSVVQTAVSVIMAIVTALTPVFNAIWTVITYAAKAAFVVVSLVIFAAIQGIATVLRGLATVAMGVWNAIVAAVNIAVGIMQAIWTAYVNAVLTAWGYIAAGVQVIMSVVTSVVQAATSAIGTIITTVATVAANVWQAIASTAAAIWQGLVSVASAVWQAIINAIQAAWAMLEPIIMPVIDAFIMGLNQLEYAAIYVWQAIQTAAGIAWDAINTIVETVLNGIKVNIDYAEAVINAAWAEVQAAASAVWAAISAFVTSVLDTIAYYVQYVESVASAAWAEIQAAADAAWNAIVSTVQSVIDTVMSTIDEGVAYVTEKWEHLKSIFSSPINAVVNFIKGGDSSAATAADVSENAKGGIYEKGAFLTTFAEDSAEAAIPLDGSQRAISLWMQAGERLGTLPQIANRKNVAPQMQAATQAAAPAVAMQNTVIEATAPQVSEQTTQVVAAPPVNNAPVSLSFNPSITVEGNADPGVVAAIQQQLEKAKREFESQLPQMMQRVQARQRRLAYD